jgi:hypothetical protein
VAIEVTAAIAQAEESEHLENVRTWIAVAQNRKIS